MTSGRSLRTRASGQGGGEHHASSSLEVSLHRRDHSLSASGIFERVRTQALVELAMQSGSAPSGSRADAGDDPERLVSDLTAPEALRKLVLNYLVHHCYIDTAQAFVDDGAGSSSAGNGPLSPTTAAASLSGRGAVKAEPRSPSLPPSNGHSAQSGLLSSPSRKAARTGAGASLGTYPHPLAAPPLSHEDSSMDVEVDSLLSLAGESKAASSSAAQAGSDERGELSAAELDVVRVRKEVRDCILSGQIGRAIELLHHHFPTVLPPTTLGKDGSHSATSSSADDPTVRSARPGDGKEEGSDPNPRILPANPTSLDPQHLFLNLHIQAFIESMRAASTTPAGSGPSPYASSTTLNPPAQSHQSASAMPSMHSLVSSTPGLAAAAISRSASPAPSSASSSASVNSGNGMSGSMHSASGPGGSHSVTPAVNNALVHARWLYEECHRLPRFWRAMYLKELENVTAMLAYSNLERSPVRKYLDQARRVALAEQINSAIVFRLGKPSQALIESAVRQTTFCWSTMAIENVGVPTNHAFFTSGLASTVAGVDTSSMDVASMTSGGQQGTDSSASNKNKSKVMPAWDLKTFLAR